MSKPEAYTMSYLKFDGVGLADDQEAQDVGTRVAREANAVGIQHVHLYGASDSKGVRIDMRLNGDGPITTVRPTSKVREIVKSSNIPFKWASTAIGIVRAETRSRAHERRRMH